MFCKIFDLPLKEQEGVKITQEAAIAASKEEEPKSFQNSPRVQAVLTAAAPESFYEGDSSYDYNISDHRGREGKGILYRRLQRQCNLCRRLLK